MLIAEALEVLGVIRAVQSKRTHRYYLDGRESSRYRIISAAKKRERDIKWGVREEVFFDFIDETLRSSGSVSSADFKSRFCVGRGVWQGALSRWQRSREPLKYDRAACVWRRVED